MNINIYSKYSVKYISHYSHYSEDSTRFDIDFVTEGPEVSRRVLEGGTLLEDIGKLFKDKDLDEVEVNDDSMYFGFFNPTTGLTSDITIVIEDKEVVV